MSESTALRTGTENRMPREEILYPATVGETTLLRRFYWENILPCSGLAE